MKKIAVYFILSVFMIIGLCGCGSKADSKCVPDLNKPFCLTAQIDYDGMASEATFRKNGNADWEVEFSSPNTLSGVILKFKDNNVEASYKGLSFSVPKSALPLKSIITSFIDIADTVAAQPEIMGVQKEDMIVCEGEAELGKYEISFDKNGCLTGFSMPNLNLTIKFTQCADGTTPPVESVTETTAVTENISSDTTETAVAEMQETES